MITVEKTCTCGATLHFEGSRRGEREALTGWEQAHGEHAVEVAVHRDAGSGEFVSEAFAAAHPATTVEETVERTASRSRRQMREAENGGGRH